VTEIFDLHTHLPRRMADSAIAEVRTIALRRMDDNGIRRAVLMPLDGLYHASAEGNDIVAEVCAGTGARLLPACTVDPHDPGAIAELDRCAEAGFQAVKLHPWLQGFSPLEPEALDLARRAARHHLPLLIHDGTPPYASPLQIGELAGRVSDATVVLAHGGLMDLWPDAVAAVNRWPNVMVTLCGTASGAILRRVLESVPIERVAVGTDSGFGSADLAAHRLAVLHRVVAGLCGADAEAVLYRNAARWFVQ
jgi:predicted TIM-barrel fold metal-dependent hydrolase